MVAGLNNVICPLVAANPLEPTSRANPMITLLDTVANFIAAPLIPERFGMVGAARFAIAGEKLLSFPGNRLQCLPLGLSAQAHKLALPLWGFSHLGRQTERERIPKPRY